jgi:hypothetical protein
MTIDPHFVILSERRERKDLGLKYEIPRPDGLRVTRWGEEGISG